MRRVVSTCVAVMAFAGRVVAHPGHGTTEAGTVAHQATEPVHLLPIIAVVSATLVFWTIARVYRRRQQ